MDQYRRFFLYYAPVLVGMVAWYMLPNLASSLARLFLVKPDLVKN